MDEEKIEKERQKAIKFLSSTDEKIWTEFSTSLMASIPLESIKSYFVGCRNQLYSSFSDAILKVREDEREKIIVLMQQIIDKEKARCSEANAVTCWEILKEKLKKPKTNGDE